MALASDSFRLARRVVRGQWFMVFASLMIMAASGGTYVFAVYSRDIKSSLGYDQQALNTIGFYKDLGANLGILSGLINEVTPPWVVLSIGSAMNLFGYLMIYLAITNRLAHPKLWQMCLYICIGANSQSFANTGALITCVKNFPQSRGIVIGLLKGFVGLSGAIFAQLYHAFYGEDSRSLVLLIAWLPAVISIVFVPTIRIMKAVRQASQLRVFCSFLCISLALAGYIMVMIITQNSMTFSPPEYRASAIIILLLLFLPLAIVIKEEILPLNQKDPSIKGPRQISTAARSMKKTPERGEDHSILQALVSVDMLILFFATTFGVGGTLTAIDNMGQIGESLGYSSRSIGTFISLISIWNYMGRVAAGFASEVFLAKYKLPRPLMLALVLLISCIGHVLIALGVPGSLYVASIIIGFCFGAQVPLVSAIISEVFGLRYYSTLYNVAGLASPVGSYVLNVRVAGYLYDREAAKQNVKVPKPPAAKSLTCIGVECFRVSFIINTVVTLLGAVVMLVLVWRTWDFYKGDIYAKFKETARDDERSAGTSDGAGESREEEMSMLVSMCVLPIGTGTRSTHEHTDGLHVVSPIRCVKRAPRQATSRSVGLGTHVQVNAAPQRRAPLNFNFILFFNF